MFKEFAAELTPGEKEILKQIPGSGFAKPINDNLTPFTIEDIARVFGRLSDPRLKEQFVFVQAHPLPFYVHGLFAAATNLKIVFERVRRSAPDTFDSIRKLEMLGCNTCGSTRLHHRYGIAIDVKLSYIPYSLRKMIKFFNESGWYFMKTDEPTVFHFEATWEALEIWRARGWYAK